MADGERRARRAAAGQLSAEPEPTRTAGGRAPPRRRRRRNQGDAWVCAGCSASGRRPTAIASRGAKPPGADLGRARRSGSPKPSSVPKRGVHRDRAARGERFQGGSGRTQVCLSVTRYDSLGPDTGHRTSAARAVGPVTSRPCVRSTELNCTPTRRRARSRGGLRCGAGVGGAAARTHRPADDAVVPRRVLLLSSSSPCSK